jgi:hypothetical protein
MIDRLAGILRQKKVVETLLPQVVAEIVKAVPCEWVRFDIGDERNRIWSRSIKPGGKPERPGLGEILRVGSRDESYSKAIDGGFEACLMLGIGEPTGRMILRRKEKGFDDDMPALQAVADVVTLGFRARPMEPPPKPRSPFEEGPLL